MPGKLSAFAALVNLSVRVCHGTRPGCLHHRYGFFVDFTKFTSADNEVAMDGITDLLLACHPPWHRQSGISFYTPVHHELFSRLRDLPLRLLENGVEAMT
jgi:hypothetical protein